MRPSTFTCILGLLAYPCTNVFHVAVTVSLAGIPANAEWLIGNVEQQGYFRVNYDLNNWNALLRQLNTGQEADGDKPIARETIKIKQNLERKRIHSLVNDFGQQNDTGNRMIFTRILGHKKDMPGSGQWKLIKDFEEECWICDQEIYGLTFWDSK